MTDSTTASLASGPDETEEHIVEIEENLRWLSVTWTDEVRWLITSLRAALSENERLTSHLRDLLRENAELKKDAERLDWMQATVDGTGKTMQFGGVCYWSIEVKAGKNGKPSRLGEGDDLRDAIDAAMSGAVGHSERGANGSETDG